MKKLILHIGRHKSGTTTLQKFLFSNKELLRKYRYYYPDFGIHLLAHHEIAGMLSRKNIRKFADRYREVLAQSVSGLSTELTDITESIVISSEGFQECDPKIVRAYFKEYDVHVVVYLREQAGYLLSSYVQRVQATNYNGSMEEFYNTLFFSDYARFLRQWKAVFGPNITVRIFNRSNLLNGDIVHDFVRGVLGIPGSEVLQRYNDIDANPTLTLRLLEYKLYLNELDCVPVNMQKRIYRGLSELAKSDDSGKVLIPQKLRMQVVDDCQPGNREVAQEYFNRPTLFQERNASHECNHHYTLSADEIRDISEKLSELYPEFAPFLPKDLFKANPIQQQS